MNAAVKFRELLASRSVLLALAPMQDVTDLGFMQLMDRYGGADVYFTEYFRVYPGSHLIKSILRSVTENTTGKPVVAQMIGNDIPSLVRTAKELQKFPVAAIDLNLGCPAPVVYRKCAGGGLLREPQLVDSILGHLRDAITTTPFTVKTRIGFDDPAVFWEFLPLFAKHRLDLLTVHARTVKEMYRSEVHYEFIQQAAESIPCPVLANGNIYSPSKARAVLKSTGAYGVMIGRAAIRNPWLFRQIREDLAERPVFIPKGREVLQYIADLHATVCSPGVKELSQVQRLKKYLNFIGMGVDPQGSFLHQVRRVTRLQELFTLCQKFLDHDEPMLLEPFKMKLAHMDIMAGEHH